ncbi:MAG: Membrane protein-like protein [Parcubacteria group bacterium GW2011_GWB1_48_6]|nr:MAG: Membrane protein-like protein [Parcubacteria group bacterium GW2011_GWB1_48_6]
MQHEKLLTVAELRAAHQRPRNVNAEHLERLTSLEKVAIYITEHVGTMGFFLIIFCWTALWIGWNSLAPATVRFDPFPAFVLWLFISNMIQIMLMPLIIVGQNLQGKHAEARAQADYEVNTKAEEEIETILQHLENQNDLILQILEKLDNQ